jgi:hypothetical protein
LKTVARGEVAAHSGRDVGPWRPAWEEIEAPGCRHAPDEPRVERTSMSRNVLRRASRRGGYQCLGTTESRSPRRTTHTGSPRRPTTEPVQSVRLIRPTIPQIPEDVLLNASGRTPRPGLLAATLTGTTPRHRRSRRTLTDVIAEGITVRSQGA